MSYVQLTEALKKKLLEGEGIKEHIKRKKGTTFVRFDKLVIDASKVNFVHKGVPILYMDLPHTPNLTSGETLTIELLDGLSVMRIVNI